MLSVVIPVYNEAPSLAELYTELHWALAYHTGEVGGRRLDIGMSDTSNAVQPPISHLSLPAVEFIFVDDGSTDRSWEVLESIAAKDPRVVLVQLRRNSGKSVAYAAGFREARGDIIATLDADLQDDPAELTKLIQILGSNEAQTTSGGHILGAAAPRICPPGFSGTHDVVIGWKWQRQDLAVKIWSSRCFNTVLGWVCGTQLHDQNCGMRVMRREVAQALPLRGDLYRMIPMLAAMNGFRVAEVPVPHRPRRFGESKYGRTGLRRTLRGFFDLLTVAFLQRFRVRPLHFFGTIGGALLLIGLIINIYLTVLWLSGQKIGSRPLLLLGILLMVLGVQFFSTGFLADLVVVSRERPDTLPIAKIHRSDKT